MTDEESLKLSLKTISAKYTLANSSIINQIVKLVNDKFCGVSLYEHRCDPSLILFICDCIEEAFKNAKSKKVDKKTMVIKVMMILIPSLADPEIRSIDSIIEFLHSSGAIREIEVAVVEVSKTILQRVTSSFRKAVGA